MLDRDAQVRLELPRPRRAAFVQRLERGSRRCAVEADGRRADQHARALGQAAHEVHHRRRDVGAAGQQQAATRGRPGPAQHAGAGQVDDGVHARLRRDGVESIDHPHIGAEGRARLREVARERDHAHAVATQARDQGAADEAGGAGHEDGGNDEVIGACHGTFSAGDRAMPRGGRNRGGQASRGDPVAHAPREQPARARAERPRHRAVRRPCEARRRRGPGGQVRRQRREEHAVRDGQHRVQHPLERRQLAAAILFQEVGQRDEQFGRQQRGQQHGQRAVPLRPGEPEEDDAVDRLARRVQCQLAARRNALRQLRLQLVMPEAVEAPEQRLHGQDGEDGGHCALPATAASTTGSANTPD